MPGITLNKWAAGGGKEESGGEKEEPKEEKPKAEDKPKKESKPKKEEPKKEPKKEAKAPEKPKEKPAPAKVRTHSLFSAYMPSAALLSCRLMPCSLILSPQCEPCWLSRQLNPQHAGQYYAHHNAACLQGGDDPAAAEPSSKALRPERQGPSSSLQHMASGCKSAALSRPVTFASVQVLLPQML